MLRKLSLALRKVQSRKEIIRGLDTFTRWHNEQNALPPAYTQQKKLLVIRLDDIGDYLLFRNTLPTYKTATRWQGYQVTLLGNAAWQSIYEFADSQYADDTIWVNKKQYYDDASYRWQLWTRLRMAGYEAVVCPARARPMLLDDLCMLAAAPRQAIGGHNELLYKQWNIVSDKLYTSLYPGREMVHEFKWNISFAGWCNGSALMLNAPTIPDPGCNVNAPSTPYIICFVGGSKRSHKWPPQSWISFIEQCSKDMPYTFVLAGGKGDRQIAVQIAGVTRAINITGDVSLIEMITWMHQAAAVVTNDTMSSHLAISCGKPVLVVANGDNFYKFCGYKEAGIGHADCVYAPAFMHVWQKHHFKPFRPYVAVTADITTISPVRVIKAFKHLMKHTS